MNSILKNTGAQVSQAPQNNIQNDFNTFKQNPMQFLLSKKLNIPANLSNDPQAIVNHLLQTGQMSQGQFNQLQGMMNGMGMRM